MRLLSAVLGFALVAQGLSQTVIDMGGGRPIDDKLHQAVRQGKVETVRLLLAKGANPNVNDSGMGTPLCSLGGTSEQMLAIAKLLVARGARVNLRDGTQGWTALTNALNQGAEPIGLVRYLLQKGANPNLAVQFGMSPLHYAVNAGFYQSAKELIAHGARLNARTNDKGVVKESDPSLSPSSRRDFQRMQERIDHAFEPGYRFSGMTPAHGLWTRWSPSVAKLLVKAGASLKATDDNGWTPLHYAAKYASDSAATTLVDLGADPNAGSKGGYRPLHLALRAGYGVPHLAMVRALLAKGADPGLKNVAGQTPADMLRSDAAWRVGNPSKDPETAFPPQALPQYLEGVNEVLRVLEPNGAPLNVELPKPNPAGTRYAPLDLFDELVTRTVRVENGEAILELRLPALANASAKLTIKDLSLEEYDTLTPLPVVITRRKGTANTLTFRFPAGAARGGGVIMDVAQDGPDGGSSTSTSGHVSPSFSSFEGLSVGHSLPDRTMEFEILSVVRNGKTLKEFTGRRLLATSQKSATILGLSMELKGGSKATKTILRYRYRFLPNTKWRTSDVEFGALGG